MSDEMDEVLQEFLVESNEGLDQLDRDLVALERTPDDRELLARIFRCIHTIKGTCGFLGFGALESVTHVGENLLSLLRDGKLVLTPARTSALLELVDAVRGILQAIEATSEEGDGDYTQLIATLTALQSDDTAAPAPAAAVEPPAMGALLVAHGATTPDAVAAALAEQEAGDPRRLGEILVAEEQVAPAAVVEALEEQARAGNGAAADRTIRVDVGLLDKLMNLVGELVLARNQILQHLNTSADATLGATSQRLNLITTELQEGVMKTRMQPIGNVWSKFPRVVRDLAHTCGKQVRIEMEGKETELDKTILEAIKDPLTHIVRNSVDHGIEAPDARRQAGKAAEGRILLRAFHEGGQVNIEISDDGRGLDAERIKAKALQKGLIAGDVAARMSDRDAFLLIFMPGFSTAEQITNVSGRGVGMDVVRTNIEKIGGTVDVASTAGQGTTLRIRIPLTLAIVPGLIVTSAGDRFAIPQVSLLELVRLDGDAVRTAVEMVYGAPVYRLRGNLLPLVSLNHALGVTRERWAPAESVEIVVLQAEGVTFGLVVDEINDTEEIVVKPLAPQLKNIPAFAGATIMGDGRVALILDVNGIAEQAGLAGGVRDRGAGTATGPDSETADRQTLLVFRVGAKHRVAVPLAAINRLEEFEAGMVEHAGAHPVVQYRGEIMPLVHLGTILDGVARSEERRDLIPVVVHRAGGRSIGFIVDEVVDIVEQHVTIERRARTPGVAGSAVIQERVTDILDIDAVVALAGLDLDQAPALAGAEG